MVTMIKCYRWKVLTSQVPACYLAATNHYIHRRCDFATTNSSRELLAGVPFNCQICKFSTATGSLNALHRTENSMQKHKEGPDQSNVQRQKVQHDGSKMDLAQAQARMDQILQKYGKGMTMEEIKKMNENFTAVYSFKHLFLTRKILRYHVLLTPTTWIFFYLNPYNVWFMAIAAVSTSFAALLYSFVPRIVMKMSVGKTGDIVDTVKVATMSPIGKRNDSFYKISEIVPLMELPAVTSRDWYIPFCVYGEKRRRYLFLKGANWHDLATFRRVMGEFPEDKKK